MFERPWRPVPVARWMKARRSMGRVMGPSVPRTLSPRGRPGQSRRRTAPGRACGDTLRVSGGAGSRERLAGLSVLVLDAQATAADPGRGALLEIGWARFAAAEACELAPEQVTAHLVAPPPGAVMPRGVARVTGLSPGEWARGMASGPVWEQLLCAARGPASLPGPVPVVIHFARFEEPYLRALHVRHGAGMFPFDVVCTHAIARRLLPALPRCTLRALAGYFGAGVPPRRRSAFHVAATALVWRHLVAMLGEREGVTRLDELADWLAHPARRAPRAFPLARE